MIKFKKKIIKQGKVHIIIIPSQYIKDNTINPEKEYFWSATDE